MLYQELLDVEDPHVKLLTYAFTFLHKLEISEDLESFVESVHTSTNVYMFDIKLNSERIYAQNLSDAIVLKYTHGDFNSSYDDGVNFVFNKHRLLSLKCISQDKFGNESEWLITFTKSKMLQQNDGTSLRYDLIREHLLQYSTVSPLAGYILEFADRV